MPRRSFRFRPGLVRGFRRKPFLLWRAPRPANRAASGFRPSRKRKKYFQFRVFLFFFLSFAVLLFAFSLLQLNSKMLPSVLDITDLQTKTRLNTIIYESVQDIVHEMGVSSNDFFKKTTDSDGKINTLSVNTMLVNEICAKVAVDVSDRLVVLRKDVVSLPIGALMGIEALANFGPSYSLTVIPMGNALVDYDTSFVSVGINQINFQVWLTVDSSVQVVNPLQKRQIVVSRKISLVNTIFNGEVPSVYLKGGMGS